MAQLTKAQKLEQEAAIRELRELLPPGSTVYVKLNHVSKSGMQRVIDPLIFVNNEPRYIRYLVSMATDRHISNKHDGIVCDGCGMDMGFDLVYRLSQALYDDGFTCTGDHCPSNDHLNGMREYGPHVHHNSGGYALKFRWL